IDEAPGRQWRTAVEHTNVVQAKKAALEDIPPLRVFPIYPPGEVQHQLVENAFKEGEVAGVIRVLGATLLAVHLEHAPCRPGMDRWIHVTKSPLIGGELTIRVHIPFAREQNELTLCEL